MSSLTSLIFDRTQLDVLNDTEKGSYTASDLNRVITAMKEVQSLLNSSGYNVLVKSQPNWVDNELNYDEEMLTYLLDLQHLRDTLQLQNELLNVAIVNESVTDSFAVSGNGGVQIVPESMDNLTTQIANNIERILVRLFYALDSLKKSVVPCGTATSGGEYL